MERKVVLEVTTPGYLIDLSHLSFRGPRDLLFAYISGAGTVRREPFGIRRQDPRPGRFILTGSQNLLLMESVSQTLAGRAGILHLLPFSRAELDGQTQGDPGRPSQLFAGRESRLDCWELIRSGSYPPIHDRRIPPEVWLSDYVRMVDGALDMG